ncbi:uncharacterized protein LOC116212754 [Punica granatum]|uniref:Uncharacterized protein LOC116212754 n=1 Tax=Punica granatum TaxID=22663 RepID=A0A6P8E9T1_PUNGR|nr:uncharacterized protein LOC116212754 [Punica granatum]
MDGTTGCGEIGVVAMSPEDALAAWFRKRFPNQDKPATIGTKSSGNNQHLKAKELEEKITVNPGAGAVRPSRGTTSSATACPKSKNHMKQSIFFIGFPQKEAGDDSRAIGFGDLVKSCASCKKEFESEKDVYMYRASAFCSLECRDKRIASDGYTRKQVGLKNNVGGTTPKPLGKNPSIRPAHA